MSFVMLHSTFPESTRTSPGQAIWHSHFDILPKSDKTLPKKRRFMQFTCMVIALPLHDSCLLLCQTSKWTFSYHSLLWLCWVFSHWVSTSTWWHDAFLAICWAIQLPGPSGSIYVTQLCLIWTQQLEKVFPSCAIVAVASPIMQLSASHCNSAFLESHCTAARYENTD